MNTMTHYDLSHLLIIMRTRQVLVCAVIHTCLFSLTH